MCMREFFITASASYLDYLKQKINKKVKEHNETAYKRNSRKP